MTYVQIQQQPIRQLVVLLLRVPLISKSFAVVVEGKTKLEMHNELKCKNST